MEIAGGVFGSGASCDAGDVRLVTLDHFGAAALAADSRNRLQAQLHPYKEQIRYA